MSELQRIPDHVAAGQNLAMAQYQNKPNFMGLLAAVLSQNQRIEDALFSLLAGRQLVNPATSGQTLDNIGDLVGVGRNGLDDATYRVLLYAKIADNGGNATLQTLLRVAAALFQSQALFDKTPNTLARSGQNRGGYVVLMVGSPAVPTRLFPLISRLLQQTFPAGVELAHLGTFNATKAFAFKGPQAWVGGWGDVADKTVGAPLADLISTSTY